LAAGDGDRAAGHVGQAALTHVHGDHLLDGGGVDREHRIGTAGHRGVLGELDRGHPGQLWQRRQARGNLRADRGRHRLPTVPTGPAVPADPQLILGAVAAVELGHGGGLGRRRQDRHQAQQADPDRQRQRGGGGAPGVAHRVLARQLAG
jgi:hypothetical protein